MAIAIAQLKICPGRPELNRRAMLSMIDAAAARGASLILFPELAISGLLLGNLAQNGVFIDECLAADRAIAAAAPIPVIYGNLAKDAEGRLHNVVNLAHQGEIRRLEAARGASYIPNAYDLFAPASAPQVYLLNMDGGERRVGFRLGDWQGRAFDSPALDLLVDLSAGPLLLDGDGGRPLPAQCAYLRVNGCGLQNSGKTNYLLAGGSFAQNAAGQLTARAPLFEQGLYVWEERGGSAITPLAEPDQLLADGLISGVREFLDAIGCGKAVIGLSGGIDSAVAACVYTRALGPENVYLINMPSRFNSCRTKDLAERLAVALGCPYAVMPVEGPVNQLIGDLAAVAFRDGAGRSSSLSIDSAGRENVLARDRTRILAAAAAAVDGIFACNGNKAECSVGYATFYGDLAGAFAAQADLWKFQVYGAARALQRLYPEAPLAEIAALRPSAELSEAQDVDRGLGDPLHYPYHDYLLRSWVEQGLDISDTLRLYLEGRLESLIGCAPGLTAALFKTEEAFCADLEYWWKMYRGIGVAKRIQAPPLLAFSRHPFGEPQGEAQLGPWFSDAYRRLKQEALA